MVSKFHILRLTISVLALSVAIQGYGSEKSTSDSILLHLNLKEVSIIGDNFREIVPVQRLAGNDLKNLNSYSVADALRYFTGIQMKDFGGVGGIKTVDIRSMGANHVGIFYDGIQLGNAQNGQIDLGMYSLDNIDEIAMYNGQKGEIFQSAKDFGSAGTLYIRSRRPKFECGRPYHLKATMRCGSFGMLNPSLLLESKITDSISVSLSAEYVAANGKYKFRYKRVTPNGNTAYDTTAMRENGDIMSLRVEGGIYGYIHDGYWRVKFYTYNSERGIPGAIVNNVWRRGERLWDNNTFVQGSFQKDFTRKYKALLNTKYAYYNTHYTNNDTKLIAVDNRYKQKEFYISTAHSYSVFKFWDIALAYDYQWNSMWSDLKDFAFPKRSTHMLALATSFQVWRVKIEGSCLGTFVRDKTKTGINQSHQHAFSPSLLFSMKPLKSGDLTLRAFCKRNFIMPTFNDLYYVDMGNASLRPEYATQYDGGITYMRSWGNSFVHSVRIQADGYYNEVTDKIVAYPKGQQFRWTMLNLGNVKIKGVDLSAETTLFPVKDLLFTLKGQYTFQKAIDVTDSSDSYYGDQIPYVPLHSMSAIVQGNYRGWIINYSFIYAGERYSQQQNIAVNYMQPWYTHDISLTKEFRAKFGTLKGTFEVNNFLNQSYDVILNYPMPGINYRFTLSFEI
ncbi:MAG: TonB-dependent receptor [Bacteroidales bacterium]